MRYATLITGLALLLATAPLGADPAEPTASQPAQQVIKVKTPAEFAAAIGSNRIIQIVADEIDLSEIEHKNTRNLRWGLDPSSPDDAVVIRHVENLTIEGAGDKPARIVTPSSTIYVLIFQDASHLQLKNLEMVHEAGAAECSNGVLNLVDARDVTIEKCTLSGSGTEGIVASEVDGLVFKNSTITHCSEDLMTGTELSHARFMDSNFTGNTLFQPGLSFTTSPSVSFTNCVFKDNKQPNGEGPPDSFISTDDSDCKISLTGCTFEGNTGTEFAMGDGTVTIKECQAKENLFAVDPNRKPVPKPKGEGQGKG